MVDKQMSHVSGSSSTSLVRKPAAQVSDGQTGAGWDAEEGEGWVSMNDVGARMGAFVRHVEGLAAKVETATYGSELARHRMPLPDAYGTKRNPADLPHLAPHILRIFRSVFGCYLRYTFARRPKSNQAPASLFAELEQHALELGATAIGYAEITPDLIFKDFVIPHRNAIVIISKMRRETFGTAPSTEAMVEVAKAYADTTSIANDLAIFLRRQGFSAYPGISLGGSVEHTRVAERAGLGKIGYHGSLISPEEGARVRINVVYTNIENLPFPEQNPHDWVLDFCDRCRKCVRKCPADAIRSDTKPSDGRTRLSVIDPNRCGPYMAANHGCGVCIAVCPFSNAGYAKVQAGFSRAQAKLKAKAASS